MRDELDGGVGVGGGTPTVRRKAKWASSASAIRNQSICRPALAYKSTPRLGSKSWVAEASTSRKRYTPAATALDGESKAYEVEVSLLQAQPSCAWYEPSAVPASPHKLLPSCAVPLQQSGCTQSGQSVRIASWAGAPWLVRW